MKITESKLKQIEGRLHRSSLEFQNFRWKIEQQYGRGWESQQNVEEVKGINQQTASYLTILVALSLEQVTWN